MSRRTRHRWWHFRMFERRDGDEIALYCRSCRKQIARAFDDGERCLCGAFFCCPENHH